MTLLELAKEGVAIIGVSPIAIGCPQIYIPFYFLSLLPSRLQVFCFGIAISCILWFWSMCFSFPRKIKENAEKRYVNTLMQLLCWADLVCFMAWCFCWGMFFTGAIIGEVIGYEPVSMSTHENRRIYGDLWGYFMENILYYVVFRFVVHILIRRNRDKGSTYKVQLTKKKP